MRAETPSTASAPRAKRIFAVRTTEQVYRTDDVEGILRRLGFVEVAVDKRPQREGFGVARIFVRET